MEDITMEKRLLLITVVEVNQAKKPCLMLLG